MNDNEFDTWTRHYLGIPAHKMSDEDKKEIKNTFTYAAANLNCAVSKLGTEIKDIFRRNNGRN